MHVRTQIRNQVVAALTGLATTATRVYSGRALPVDPAKLGGPALLISGGSEDITRSALGVPHEQAREIQILVRGVAKTGDDLEDVLDQIALEVEAAMANAAGVLALVPDMALAAVRAGIDESLEKPCGVIELTFAGRYFAMSNNPEVAL